MTDVLAVQGLVAGYDGVPVVRDLDLTVAAGEIVAVLGPNGAGKTTTLLTISGLVAPLGGTILLGGRPAPRGWRLARAGVAHVPEDRGLFFGLTAAENLRLGARRGAAVVPRDQILDWFPALGPVLDRKAGLLSGGEQQMLALARAVISRPSLLLVDELSLGLAPIVVERILPVLRQIATETGAGVVVVEQHVGLVLQVADRALLLRQGVVTFSGTSAEVAARPDLVEASYLGDV